MKLFRYSSESKVGGLVFLTAVLFIGLAWVIGIRNPFLQTVNFYVTYRFAGGIEVGSPVRVSGIKVGRVEKIEFFVPTGAPAGKSSLAPVRLKISIQKEAAVGVRHDSQFFINMAGIIGERYVEVSPGSEESPAILDSEVVAGIDPPRIDQLLSQSFDLAGKIKDIIDQNKGDLTRSIELLFKLSTSLNKTLAWVDQSALFKTDLSRLSENLIAITSDVRRITEKSRTPEGEKTLKLLYDLLWRLEPLDSANIRTFLQKEGIKAHLF